MKYRSRKYKTVSETPSYWPSFVDIMATMCLVFLFIMLIYSGINKLFVDNIVDNRVNLYNEIDELLAENDVDENIITFDRENGLIKISTETFFEKNESTLTEEGKNTAYLLRNIFYKLLSDPENGKDISENIKYIEVVGYTDYIGTTIDNRRLSTDRARSFLDAIMPMDSALENEYGEKFKASGMSEFEQNKTKKERDRTEYEDEAEAAAQRKIEVKIQFNEKDIEKAVADRMKSQDNK